MSFSNIRKIITEDGKTQENTNNLPSNCLLYITNGNQLKRSNRNISTLTELNLSNNEIEEIENSAFDSLVNLKSLTLSNNKLQQVNKWFNKVITTLTWLNLNDNEIDIIENGAFDSLVDLLSLNLSNNN
jgi:hypothetical protein